MKKLPLLLISLLLAGCATPYNGSQKKTCSRNQKIQEITDKAVADAKGTLNPKGMAVVVADPKTGKILSMNGWRKNAIPELRNSSEWVGLTMFEPGSTFKPFVVAAALDRGVITPKSKIYCEKGLFHIVGKTIKDHFPAGDLTYDEILSKSSNIGASKIALIMKDEDFYNSIRNFGFGEKTGIAVPWETKGYLRPPSQWDPLSKTRNAFGQSIAVTPIQLTMAYCALANGGKLMKPVKGDEKAVFVRRACSAATAERIKNALKKSVSKEGTAPLAHVDGVEVAGKTGTAQAVGPKGTYLTDQYWTMFTGIFPADHPKYVITVVVDEADLPQEKNYGGLVAAPIFADIAGKILKINKN
jgi:cell division protein FtsI (penicillin-binding protein 3)